MDRAVALARLSSMVAADQRPVLSTDDLDVILDGSAIVDGMGRLVSDADWEGEWDLNHAAAEGWRTKAGRVAGDFTFSADGESYSKGDVMAKCLAMAAEYAAKTSGVWTVTGDRSAAPYDSPRLVL